MFVVHNYEFSDFSSLLTFVREPLKKGLHVKRSKILIIIERVLFGFKSVGKARKKVDRPKLLLEFVLTPLHSLWYPPCEKKVCFTLTGLQISCGFKEHKLITCESNVHVVFLGS